MEIKENPIVRGYRWAQQFTLPTGTLEPFDEVVATVHWTHSKNSSPAWYNASTLNGALTVDGQVIQLDIPPEKTVGLTHGLNITFDFKRVRGEDETYFGLNATFPIREPLTKGKLG